MIRGCWYLRRCKCFLAQPRPVRICLVRGAARAWPSRGARSALLVAAFRSGLQGAGRRAQVRVVPSLLAGRNSAEVLTRVVTSNLRSSSRHAEVREATWADAQALLPQARELAGTFADGSGPNCFGTVMAAAGVGRAAQEWMQREPFEQWLAAVTTPVRDHLPGTVFVWRSERDGLVQHAALTLGDGWVLNKSSQSWATPRLVQSVKDVKAASRTVGWHLSRHKRRRRPHRPADGGVGTRTAAGARWHGHHGKLAASLGCVLYEPPGPQATQGNWPERVAAMVADGQAGPPWASEITRELAAALPDAVVTEPGPSRCSKLPTGHRAGVTTLTSTCSCIPAPASRSAACCSICAANGDV